MKKFWIVLGVDASWREVPYEKHKTELKALQEAQELTIANPTDTFVILEAIATCQLSVAPVLFTTLPPEPKE